MFNKSNPSESWEIQRSKCEGVTIVFMPSPKCVCNFQSTFIKAGDCETKEGRRVEAKGLRVEEAKGESLAVLCFGSLETL